MRGLLAASELYHQDISELIRRHWLLACDEFAIDNDVAVPVRDRVDVGPSLGKRVNRVELNVPAESARPLNLLLLAGREHGQAIPRVGPSSGESIGFSIVGDQRLPERIRIAERRKEHDRPVADDAGRATGIVEADKDLAQVLVPEQVLHWG